MPKIQLFIKTTRVQFFSRGMVRSPAVKGQSTLQFDTNSSLIESRLINWTSNIVPQATWLQTILQRHCKVRNFINFAKKLWTYKIKSARPQECVGIQPYTIFGKDRLNNGLRTYGLRHTYNIRTHICQSKCRREAAIREPQNIKR